MKRFAPYYQPALWGGRRFETVFNRTLPPNIAIGEAWELAEMPAHHSAVYSGGEEGARLGELWRSGELGGSGRGDFPFLLKWIDAQKDLSVQVHPDKTACQAIGSGREKNEAWLVAAAPPGSRLYLGHKPELTESNLLNHIQNHTLIHRLHCFEPQIGDMVFVPAGTIHAIGAGLLLLEVQQPSDTTFRLYDWGRLDDAGQPRSLHVEQARKSIRFADTAPLPVEREAVVGPGFSMQHLIPGKQLASGPLRVLVATLGAAQIQSESGAVCALRHGDVVVAEKRDGTLVVTQGRVALLSEHSKDWH